MGVVVIANPLRARPASPPVNDVLVHWLLCRRAQTKAPPQGSGAKLGVLILARACRSLPNASPPPQRRAALLVAQRAREGAEQKPRRGAGLSLLVSWPAARSDEASGKPTNSTRQRAVGCHSAGSRAACRTHSERGGGEGLKRPPAPRDRQATDETPGRSIGCTVQGIRAPAETNRDPDQL